MKPSTQPKKRIKVIIPRSQKEFIRHKSKVKSASSIVLISPYNVTGFRLPITPLSGCFVDEKAMKRVKEALSRYALTIMLIDDIPYIAGETECNHYCELAYSDTESRIDIREL